MTESASLQVAEIKESPDFQRLSATLVMELAAGLSSPSEIFSRWGYNRADAVRMLQNPAFQQLLKEAKAAWSKDANAHDRIKIKATLALEELLVPHFIMAKHPDTSPTARIEAVKTFERLSGMAAKEKEGGGGEGRRFVVNINLGDDPGQKVTIDAPVLEDSDGQE